MLGRSMKTSHCEWFVGSCLLWLYEEVFRMVLRSPLRIIIRNWGAVSINL